MYSKVLVIGFQRLSKEHNYYTYSTFEPRFSMRWDFSKISLLGLGFRQKIGWEMGFGPNFGWEMGFVPPPPLQDPLLCQRKLFI